MSESDNSLHADSSQQRRQIKDSNMRGIGEGETPLRLPLTAEGYAAANEAFRQCWMADRAEVLAFLRADPPQISGDGMDVLGIGVGDGSFDMRIIACLRELYGNRPIKYVAVEPNEAQMQGFRERASTLSRSGVEFTFRQEMAEEYVPERLFDLIHYIHSLYHMPGSEERLILQAVAHLQPGGRLLIALSSEQGGIYQMMQRFWDVIDYSFFTGGLFGQESLRAVLERNKLAYHDELYPDVAIDVTACFDPMSELGMHLLNFLLQADMQRAPTAVRTQALDTLAELSRVEAGRRLLPHPSGVFMVSAAR